MPQDELLYHAWPAEVIQANEKRAYIVTDPPVNAGRIRMQGVSFRDWFRLTDLIFRAPKCAAQAK
jgi:hypothetical protein